MVNPFGADCVRRKGPCSRGTKFYHGKNNFLPKFESPIFEMRKFAAENSWHVGRPTYGQADMCADQLFVYGQADIFEINHFLYLGALIYGIFDTWELRYNGGLTLGSFEIWEAFFIRVVLRP